jgi:hypothetical protein
MVRAAKVSGAQVNHSNARGGGFQRGRFELAQRPQSLREDQGELTDQAGGRDGRGKEVLLAATGGAAGGLNCGRLGLW